MPAWKTWRPRRADPKTSPAPDDGESYEEETAEPHAQDAEDLEDVEEAEEAEEEDAQEDAGVPWYSVRTPGGLAPDGPQTWTVAPGVQITVPAPQQPAEPSRTSLRQQRIRRWLVRHALAAGVGWLFGLYQSMSAFLNGLGHGGAAAGLALAGFGWWGAELVTDYLGRLPLVPRRALPAVHQLARVPFATALLVTLLYAPQAHL